MLYLPKSLMISIPGSVLKITLHNPEFRPVGFWYPLRCRDPQITPESRSLKVPSRPSAHSGIFHEKFSHAQKMLQSAKKKSKKFFSPEFNQTWLSFRYIPKDTPCKKFLKSNKGFLRIEIWGFKGLEMILLRETKKRKKYHLSLIHI